MVSINEYLDFNLDSGDVEVEKKQIASRILAISKLSADKKKQLAQGFLDCIVNGREELLRRIQAASLVANQSEILNIIASEEALESILTVLKNEFSSNGFRKNSTYFEVVFFKQLIHAGFAINRVKTESFALNFFSFNVPDEVASWLKELTHKREFN